MMAISPQRSLGSGIFKDIKEVPPAYCLTYNENGIKLRQYWELEAKEHTEDLGQTTKHLRELLVDAIERQLVSDVPVCTFLSGGLDSSFISYIAAKAFERDNKEKLNTDISSTHSIPFHSLNPSPLEDAAQLPERKRKEATDAYSVYEEIIKDNIEYDYLIQDRYLDRDRIEEILALILETVCTKRRTIRIAGDDHPAELVKAKFMKLNSEHIRFVLDCMQENTTKIRNIKQYMKAALFNAPSTIGSYYTSLVSHDMYGGRTIQSARSKGIPDYTCNEGESL